MKLPTTLERYPAGSLEDLAVYERNIAEGIIASGGLQSISGGLNSLTIGSQTSRLTTLPAGLVEGWADGVDSANAYSLKLSSSRVTIGIDVSPGFVMLNGSAGSGFPCLSDDALKEFLESVVAVINDYPLTLDELGDRPFRMFIGHGGDQKWKTIKRLLETEGYEIEAFESETRVGYATLETIDLMIHGCSVGVVIMTGTDTMKDDSLRARENVVHEIGYCMGALGIRNTIVLLGNGVSEFSNMQGITQIRFPRVTLVPRSPNSQAP